MPVPDFILRLRERIGTDPLWLPGVTAVVLRGDGRDEVLLVRRSDNGAWTPVTGIVDPGEHPARTAVREAAEETGVEIEVEALAWVSVTDPVVHVNGDRAQYLDHTFRCRYISGEPYPADDESTAAGWFRLDDLPPMREIYLERIRTAVEHDGSTRLE
ncbi:NUDIX hydrolase [Zhihengliuella halotolerans]|uniref:ADP-ribose pyrophosphatase YjhB (NUDIX family) n=1 Tax=Zhihengliuella halotolerans TaxID=370736 RepID=A0A4Q8AEQ8_9MICC|nr:NUDIX domain-containing protein [Zhihengliuella halotolerans]RZU62777.1 ADP-ribose pyrophosphatase YjhB (NUDIX family) [Zhihengliuella halotolerans]